MRQSPFPSISEIPLSIQKLPISTGKARRRQSGSLLLELLVAMTILVIGILGFLVSFNWNFKGSLSMDQHDTARVALENVTEMLRDFDFEQIHSSYGGSTITVPELEAPGGGPAQVSITCHVNEMALPASFGPVMDLDGDGTLQTADCSSTYKLLPVHLSISYLADYGPETREVFLALGPSK